MKLLLALLSVTIVGTPVTGITLYDVTSGNVAVDYYVDVSSDCSERYEYGRFELRSPPQYVLSTKSSVIIFVHPTILLRGVGISDTNTIISQAVPSYVATGAHSVNIGTFPYAVLPLPKQAEYRFILNTYLLGIPNPDELQDGVKVQVCAKTSTNGDSDKMTIGVVVLLNREKKYVMISGINPEEYNVVTIKAMAGGTIYEFQNSHGVKGPFAALPIKVE